MISRVICIICVLICVIVIVPNCNLLDNDLSDGPIQLNIKVSDGTKPDFSWHGGDVCFISVSREDTTITTDNGYIYAPSSTPTVWGYLTIDKDSTKVDRIHSPVVFGAVFENAIDKSDSSFRCEYLEVGVTYRVQIANTGPGKVGTKLFTVSE